MWKAKGWCVLIAMAGAVLTAVADWKEINAQARDAASRPIRPGGVNGSPFWNVKARAFMNPPAFDFKAVASAHAYRFTVVEKADGKTSDCVLPTPTAALTPVWGSIRPGYVTVTCEGLSSEGKVVGLSGTRDCYRAAIFKGPYPEGRSDYRAAARRVYASVYNLPQVQGWLTSDDPPEGYDLYCYPAKIMSSMIRALCRHAKAAPAERERALVIACKMADWLIAHSQPPDAPLADCPPTYWGDRRGESVRFKGQQMMLYPAHAANAYFDLAEVTGETKYETAAVKIARTYVRIQGADGTWPLKVYEKDGRSIHANRLVPSRYVFRMFDQAFARTGEGVFKTSAEKAFDAILKGPCMTWNWDGQFEDVDPLPPYQNLQKGVAIDTANRLFALRGDNTLARELVAWCEDQFVVWSDPIHHMDWKNWKMPTALEQYEYYTPIDASMGDMIGAFANAYAKTREPLYLAKGKALADNITRHQRQDGTIPTYFDSRTGSDWVNCMVYVADRLECLADAEATAAVGSCRIVADFDRPGSGRILVEPSADVRSGLTVRQTVPLGDVFVSYAGCVFSLETPAPTRFSFGGCVRDLMPGKHRIVVWNGILWTLSPYATWDHGQLVVEVPKGVQDGEIYGATAYIGLAAYENRALGAKVMARGENVALPGNSCHGLKLMLHFTALDTGDDCWPDAPHRIGTWDKSWLEVGDLLSGGARSSWGTVHVGLQGTSGKVVFDMNTFEITTGEPLYPRVNGDYRVSYPKAVSALPQLRGVQLPAVRCTEDDFKTLADWGATLVRYQMTNAPHVKDGEPAETALSRYFNWLNERLDHLDREVLPWANRYGMKVVIDLHEPPGKRVSGGAFRMMVEERYRAAFLEVWRQIATRFKGRPGVYGYDLVNEPHQLGKVAVDYWNIQRMAAEEIRKIDEDTPILIESNAMDSPRTFSYLSPLKMDNVIYEVHMYEPGDYTHQGVRGEKDFARLAYPNGQRNREYLVKSLAAVRQFEQRHGAKIYVGEFSAAAWAPGADQYLRDCIEIFKEYGWDWTYHAFREWPGWSVEHEAVKYGVSDDCFKPSADNPRKRVLIDGLRGK